MAVEAAQRALALFQAWGNLHCFAPATSAPGLRHRFARLLAAELRAAPPVGAPRYPNRTQCTAAERAAWRLAHRPLIGPSVTAAPKVQSL